MTYYTRDQIAEKLGIKPRVCSSYISTGRLDIKPVKIENGKFLYDAIETEIEIIEYKKKRNETLKNRLENLHNKKI